MRVLVAFMLLLPGALFIRLCEALEERAHERELERRYGKELQ